MSDPEFLPMETLALRFNVAASTLADRISAANRKKAGAVRTRGKGRWKEYAIEDVRGVMGGTRSTYKRRVG